MFHLVLASQHQTLNWNELIACNPLSLIAGLSCQRWSLPSQRGQPGHPANVPKRRPRLLRQSPKRRLAKPSECKTGSPRWKIWNYPNTKDTKTVKFHVFIIFVFEAKNSISSSKVWSEIQVWFSEHGHALSFSFGVSCWNVPTDLSYAQPRPCL